MAAVVERKLSKEEFHARYGGEKPYFEYWDGEAVQKSMPTWLHGLIQGILQNLLREIGFVSATEITLHIDPSYEAIPDIIAMEEPPEGAYPTKPFEVVVEILSPDDAFSRVLRKCSLYEKWGIRQIVVVDPEERIIWRFVNGAPVQTDVIAYRGDAKVLALTLWQEVDRRKPS